MVSRVLGGCVLGISPEHFGLLCFGMIIHQLPWPFVVFGGWWGVCLPLFLRLPAGAVGPWLGVVVPVRGSAFESWAFLAVGDAVWPR